MHIPAPQQTDVSKPQPQPPPLPEMVYSPSVAEAGKVAEDDVERLVVSAGVQPILPGAL